MFETFELVRFGHHLRTIRRNLNLTQADVEKKTGLTSDTIRRIEKGEVLVRFDTIVLLSDIYRRDLINDLKQFSNSYELMSYYLRLDELIVMNEVSILRELKSDFHDQFDSSVISNPIVIDSKNQFILFLDAISELFNNNYDDALELLKQAIHVFNPEFDLVNLKQHKYSVFEFRILLVIAVVLAKQKDVHKSNDILLFIKDKFGRSKEDPMLEKMLLIKVYANLSNNYHLMNSNQEALDYAQDGLDYCLSNQLFYGTHNLLYRIGIAKHNLGHDDFLIPLTNSIHILEMQNRFDLVKLYLDRTRDIYQIDLAHYLINPGIEPLKQK